MKLKREENLLVVSNKEKDLNEVLNSLAAKDSKKVAAFLVENASLPRELRIGALRLVLNDYVKIAKELVLSDEFMYRLNWYQKFPEYQLVNFWNILASSNADKFNEEQEVVRFKKTFYMLLLMNADAVEFTDQDLENLLNLTTPESTLESFKEFMSESDGAFYDYEYNFDGMSYEDFKTVLKKCSTVSDIRNIAAKYGISVPKRLKKEELVSLVLEGLRRQGKATDETEAELKKMSAISLQRYAKVNGVKASTEMKKDDIIDYIMNRIDSTPKAVRKPRIELASLPEITEFVFSKDYLREVNIVDDEEEEVEVQAAVEAPAVAEVTPVVEEVAPVVEETPVVEEVPVVEETPVIEETPVEEPAVVEIPVVEEAEPVVEETPLDEVEAETEIVSENTTLVANEQLVDKIEQLLAEREEREKAEEERYNKMVELYEQRLSQLEEMIVNIQSQQKTVSTAPITINLTYPTQGTQTVQITPTEAQPEVVVTPLTPVIEETPAPVEEVQTPAVEVTPVVVDPTFDTLTPSETAVLVEENMEGVSLRKGTVVVAAVTPNKPTKDEKLAAKRQRKEDKRLEKETAKEEERLRKEELKRIKEEKLAAKQQQKADKKLEKELIKLENELYKQEKKLEKQEKKLEKKNKKEEAAAIKAEKERVKEERILNQERLKAEKQLAKERQKEEKAKVKESKKQAKRAKKEKKVTAKANKIAKKERRLLERELTILSNDEYKQAKKQAKIEKIRVKNDLAIYRKAKRKAFWATIKFIIFLLILLVAAAFTITTLIDLNIIADPFATMVNDFTTAYIPFMAPETGAARVAVTNFVIQTIEFINGLFGTGASQPVQ